MEQEGAIDKDEIDQIETAIKENTLKKFTKAKLIRFCKFKKILTTGTKGDIMERLSKKLKVD
jgi:hypothetical protein